MDYLDWKESIQIDEPIKKIHYITYEPHIATDINQEIKEIRIVLTGEDQYVLPSESYLYKEGQLTHKNTNNCSIANQQIEGYNNQGQATIIKMFVKYPSECTNWSRFV